MKVLKKLKILIVLVLIVISCYYKSYSQINNSYSSTGSYSIVDTVSIKITVDMVKNINKKLIERNYLIKINKEQENIIDLKNEYIKEQNIIIKDFQNKLHENILINEELNKKIIKEKNKNKYLIYSLSGTIITCLTILLIK